MTELRYPCNGGGVLGALIGKSSVTVVPWPSSDVMVIDPPDCPANPFTMERPSPVPAPLGLVVKNGSMARLSTSGGIPVPWSETTTKAVAGPLLSSRPVRIAISPPSGMASAAFLTRLRSAISICMRFVRCRH